MRACAILLLALASGPAWSASGEILFKGLTRFASGGSLGMRPLLQADGKIVVVGGATLGWLQFSATRFNADGSLDTTYGALHDGTQFKGFVRAGGSASSAAFQADGKLVIVGTIESNTASLPSRSAVVTRLNADGTVDTSFASGAAFLSGNSFGQAVAIQPDGKILAGGTTIADNRNVFMVVRLNSNGSIDNSYGNEGLYIAQRDPDMQASLESMALQPDGKLVLAGGGNGILKTQRVNADGTLDTSWGTAGSTNLSGFVSGEDTTILADGSVLVAGSYNPAPSSRHFAVAKFTSGGTLDAAFGSSGIAMAPSATGLSRGVVVQPDGRIVISGSADGISTSYAHWIVRFNADGSPDSSFGTNGEANALLGAHPENVGGLVLRGDGSFVVAGSVPSADGTNDDTSAVAFTSNGTLDMSFNGNGIHVLDLGSREAVATASALQSDGKLVVGGTFVHGGDEFGTGAFVARYRPDATLDPSFGTNGTVVFAFSALANTETKINNIESVAIQDDGRIVVGGMTLVRESGNPTPSVTFARFNPDGTLDSSFGSAGIATFPATAAREWVKAIAIQPDGKIVGAGLVKHDAITDGLVVRVTNAGALDAAFGTNGQATVNLSAASDELYGIALQPDGRIVVDGRAEVSSTQSSMAAARLNADGSLDASFGAGGSAIVSFGSATSWAYALALQPDGKIVLGGYAHPATNDDYALARLRSDGTVDTSFGSGGRATTDFDTGQQGLRAVKLLGSGKIVGAGWDTAPDTGRAFGVVQYLPDGTLDTSFASGGHVVIPLTEIEEDSAYSISVASDGTLYVAGDASHMSGLAIVAGDPVVAPQVATLTITKAGSGSGAVTSSPAGIDCGPTCSASFDTGTVVTLSAASDAGSTFGGWSGGGCSGTGPCTVTLGSSTAVSAIFDATANPPRLGNLSTRGEVLTGSDVMIGGFVIGGSVAKTVIVRAIGPSLAGFGIANALADPTLQLVRMSDGATVAANDDWGSAPNAAEISSRGFAPSDARESAILVSLEPGAYTAIVTGTGGSTGVGLAEVYEIDHPEVPLLDISTRGHVGTGSDVMIGGFVITGSAAQKVVVRAIGPSLASFGIPNPVANPTLQLVRMSDGSTVAQNDDWGSAPDAPEISASGFAPPDARESALMVTLEPGAYTAIVTGVDAGTGTGLVEVYKTQ